MPQDWDEHASWVALLNDDDDTAPGDRATLVDRLAPAFAAHHRQGKEYIKHTLIPVVEHTIHLHDAIHDDIFPRRTRAIALLDSATLRFENAARRDMISAQTRSLDALFATLDDLVRQSDLLFHTFKTSMHEHVQHLRRCTDQMPVDAERLIASLDNKAKHLGAEDRAKAKENLLRGILEKY
ncbi:hypothetical protein HD554DRAFT_2312270 [Boletus coccyginus]|nr:hypothetical protein HD554DRAFT_2312270 [Boletus coccyginus]